MADIRITIDVSEQKSTRTYPGDNELIAHIGNWLHTAGLWPSSIKIESLPLKNFMSPQDWNRLKSENSELQLENADLKLQNANLKQSWNLLHGQMADLKAANSKLLENNATFVREDDEINSLKQRVQFLMDRLASRTEEANELVRRNTQLRKVELFPTGIQVRRDKNGKAKKITIKPDRLDQP
jgi:predicted nuclease with TOPRIM domain